MNAQMNGHAYQSPLLNSTLHVNLSVSQTIHNPRVYHIVES